MMIGGIQPFRIATPSMMVYSRQSPVPRPDARQGEQRAGVRDFMRRLVDTGLIVRQLQKDWEDAKVRGGRLSAAKLTGTRSIDLGSGSAYSTLTSTEEIATATTEVGNRSPTWGTVTSTASVNIVGTYTGASSATLAIKNPIGQTFTVGGANAFDLNLLINGTKSSTITVPARYSPGTLISIGSGLSVSFGLGSIFRQDQASFDVFAGLDLTLDPSAAFDGSDGRSTYLDTPVTAGSFDINGTTITVSANDSVNTVLDSINQSGADVDATYDPVLDTVLLTRRTVGGMDIVVGNDTSGFLSAVKLASATTTRGGIDGYADPIGTVPTLSSIQSGVFELNGITFTVDTATDSVEDVIRTVNESSAGVVMALNNGNLTVRTTDTSRPITVSGDSSGFFAAFGIDEGTVEPNVRKGMSGFQRRDFEKQVQAMVSALNEMAKTVTNESLIHDALKDARNNIRNAIEEPFGTSNRDKVDSGFGLKFDVSTDSTAPFAQLGALGTKQLDRALQRNPTEVFQTFFGNSQKPGLADSLLGALDTVQNNLIDKYGSVGFMLDIYA